VLATSEIGNNVQELGFFYLENVYAVERVLLSAPFMRSGK
jgi:hypothetical protein